jgi:uncharacterized membrane protein YbhN (UPF0104 family)
MATPGASAAGGDAAAAASPQPDVPAAGAAHRRAGALRDARRHLGRKALKLLGYAVFAYLIVRLLPGLEHAIQSLEQVHWQWVLLAVTLEVLSESGFVLSWRAIVDPEGLLEQEGRGRHVAARAAWAQLGGGMFVPGGSLSSVGVGAWILHRFGMPSDVIVERQFNLQFLNTATDALALIVFGIGLAIGILPGSSNLLLTLVPAVVAALGLTAALVIAPHGEAYAQKAHAIHPKLASAIQTLSTAVEQTKRVLTHRDGLRCVVGAIGYLGFDVFVLWSAFGALGTHPAPSFAVVLMAYIIGALGGSLPLPAGAGAVGGMVGMLILYGVPHEAAVVAVLVYQAIGQLVPLVGGGIAYLLLRTSRSDQLAAEG